MPTEIDLKGAMDAAWAVVKAQIEPFLSADETGKLAQKLDEMSACYAAFWRKKLAGDAGAETDLEIIRLRAELIAARYAVMAGKVQRAVLKQILEIAAQLGAQILLAVLKR
jgi:hypothetical protein